MLLPTATAITVAVAVAVVAANVKLGVAVAEKREVVHHYWSRMPTADGRGSRREWKPRWRRWRQQRSRRSDRSGASRGRVGFETDATAQNTHPLGDPSADADTVVAAADDLVAVARPPNPCVSSPFFFFHDCHGRTRVAAAAAVSANCSRPRSRACKNARRENFSPTSL